MNANALNEMQLAFPGQPVAASVTAELGRHVRVPGTPGNAALLRRRGYMFETHEGAHCVFFSREDLLNN